MYPINGITAVSLVDMPKNHAPGLAVLFIGLIILWFGMSSLNSGSTTLIVGLLTFLGGAVLIFMTKKKWAVSIGTAGGQQHAVVSTDRAYVQRIVQALNEAVTRRG